MNGILSYLLFISQTVVENTNKNFFFPAITKYSFPLYSDFLNLQQNRHYFGVSGKSTVDHEADILFLYSVVACYR
jgi:hypothetical protein